MQKKNVIIPVYNSFADVRKCVESVLRHTDLNQNIIIADDCSTEAELLAYYRNLQENHPEIRLLISPRNNGYIKNINNVMRGLQGDVVLLNSDAIVTAGWLEKIVACAYSSDIIGVVCPLTNNGDLCSIPVFMRPNEIPDGYDIDSFAALVERISFKSYPKIPTAIGFCMFIKSAVIEKIGLFDEINLVNAYGDENDYCYRAANYGFITVIADDTFVYHRGCGSYNEQREALIGKNMEKLKKMHPNYLRDIAQFVDTNPLNPIQQNVETHLKLGNHKKNLLILLHVRAFADDSLFCDPGTGGTEFHVRDLIQGLDDFNVIVLGSSGSDLPLTIHINGERYYYKFPLQERLDFNTFYSDEYDKAVMKIITSFHIDIIHIHHLLRHTFDISRIMDRSMVPVVLTIHDYYLACPMINFINCKGMYCQRTPQDVDCDDCIKEQFGYGCNFIDGWKHNALRLLQNTDCIIAPSFAAKAIVEQYYGNRFSVDVLEHGINPVAVDLPDLTAAGTFRVAFIGVFAKHKGSGMIREIITDGAVQHIEWHLFGQITDIVLESVSRPNVSKHGYYERGQIAQLLVDHSINLVCLLSNWPETYSYTLSEAVIAGVPVMVLDIGALGERTRNLQAGWVVDAQSTGSQIIDQVLRIQASPEEYGEAVNRVRNIKLKTVCQMTEEYRKLYLDLMQRKPAVYQDQPDTVLLYNVFNNNPYMGCFNPAESADIQAFYDTKQENDYLKYELGLIKASRGWRLLSKVKENRILYRLAKTGIRVAKFFRIVG